MKKYCIIAICFFLNATLITAQEYQLDLNKSIALAKEKSLRMKSLVQDFKIAEYNLTSATSRFKTQVSMNFVSPQYTETVRQFEDSIGISFYPVKQINYQGNLLVNKRLPTDGYVYMRSGVSNFDNLKSNIRSTYLNTRFGLVQPIDVLYGFNKTKSALKEAKLAYESSQKGLKRAELDLVYRVTQSFYNLLLVQKSEEFARMDLDRQTNAFEISQNKFAAGLIREVDALQMEVDLAESKNNYDLSIVNVSSTMNYFKEIIGLNLSDSVSLSSELGYEIVIVAPQKAVEMALKNRLEIREQDIQIEINKMNMRKQKAEGLIKADLTAYYEKNGVNSTDKNTSFKNALSNSFEDFKRRPQNYGIGINVTVPILDWGVNKALVNAAKSRLLKTEIQKEELQRSIESEVRNLVADLNSSLKRLQLLEKNVAVAEKSFNITRQRFSDGDIDSQALALERNRLNNAYNSHLSAYIKYQLMLSDITRKTFYDFKTNEEIK